MPQLRRNGPTANAALHLITGFAAMAGLQLIIAGQSSITPAAFESDVNKARLYAVTMAAIAAFRLDSKAGALGVLMAASLLEVLSANMPGNPPAARLAAASLISRSGLVFGALLMPAATMIDALMPPTP